jgi:tRNA-specific 2-thiouridylase
VARKDLERNTLIVVQGHEHAWLQSTQVAVADPSWVAGHPPPPGTLAAKTRYRQADSTCRLGEVNEAGFPLDFNAAPQWAATPGQSAVLYDGEVCLGGGVISAAG